MRCTTAILLSVAFAAIIILISPLTFSMTASAATTADTPLEVDTTLDTNDPAYQACTPQPDDCSLRGAISAANADAGNAYIIALPAGTYELTLAGDGEDNNATGDLDLHGSITLAGTGVISSVISAGQRDRVIHVGNSATVIIDGVTITNGKTADGAYMPGVGLPGGPGEPGGGIYNGGTLTLTQSLVHDNETGSGGHGDFEECQFPWPPPIGETCGGTRGGTGGHGGGIYNGGTLFVDRVTLSGNRTGDGGEGGPDFGGEGGDGGSGGAIYNAPGSVMTLTRSAVVTNSTGDGGQYGDNSLSPPPVGGGDGGSGGGIHNAGTLNASAVTLSNNATGDGGSGYLFYPDYSGPAGVAGHGGAIYSSGTLSMTYATLTLNTIGNDGPGAPNTSDGRGGGIYRAAGSVSIQGSIVAHNDMPTGVVYDDCYGAPTSLGYNLVGSGTGCSSDAVGDLTTTDARLGPLADNGGDTPTHALLAGSPAIEQIPDGAGGCTAGSSADQRGMVRADGAGRGDTRCEIGAYEYGSTETTTALVLRAFSARGSGLTWLAICCAAGTLTLWRQSLRRSRSQCQVSRTR